jgi:hypothetical protein
MTDNFLIMTCIVRVLYMVCIVIYMVCIVIMIVSFCRLSKAEDVEDKKENI